MRTDRSWRRLPLCGIPFTTALFTSIHIPFNRVPCGKLPLVRLSFLGLVCDLDVLLSVAKASRGRVPPRFNRGGPALICQLFRRGPSLLCSTCVAAATALQLVQSGLYVSRRGRGAWRAMVHSSNKEPSPRPWAPLSAGSEEEENNVARCSDLRHMAGIFKTAGCHRTSPDEMPPRPLTA